MSESMWLCPECETWIGYKLSECNEGHTPPRIPVRSDDVPVDNSRRVTRSMRVKVKAKKLLTGER